MTRFALSGSAGWYPCPGGSLICRSAAALSLAGPTQEELAERAGPGVRRISDLKRGATHRPHKGAVQLLADALEHGQEERTTVVRAGRRDLAWAAEAGSETSPPLAEDRPSDVRAFLIAALRAIYALPTSTGSKRLPD